MTHEHITNVAKFDSLDFASAKKPNGRYSFGAALRVLKVSPVTLVKLANEGHIVGSKLDTLSGLTVGELASLSTSIQLLREKGIIGVRKSRVNNSV